MFIDTATISVAAGDGGNGVIAWRREKYVPKGGPAGGDGGHGGSVFVQADVAIPSLQEFRYTRRVLAESGERGGTSLCHGKQGEDLTLKVPCGTRISDATTGELIADLTTPGEQLLLCKGGRGGKGNARFKSPTHQAPFVCTEGTPGETRSIHLELKIIADIGLVGMPNAGKSSLLAALTRSPTKIGHYPFTTLFPNLGTLEISPTAKVTIADIPGIIAGANQNKGLGLSFLRHIERTKTLLFIIDGAGSEGRSPIDDFLTLQEELSAYSTELLNRPALVLLNKADLADSTEHLALFQERFPSTKVLPISAQTGQGLSDLVAQMTHLC